VGLLLGNATLRARQIVAGAITLLLIASLTISGVRIANGALKPRYQLVARFSAAGQGLLSKSDVKIRGVNIGSVKSVRLDRGRAIVRMDIDDDEKVPTTASATIRPKTLFGEKFVDIDPGPQEGSGPYLRDEQEITKAVGGFELERLLSDAYPILQAIDPDELATILSELAKSGTGLGPTINRTITNFRTVADQQAGRLAELEEFLDDLALLSETLETSAPDLVATAEDLNVALPELNARGPQLAVTLDQAARLSADVADLLEANRPFLDKSVTEGGKTLQLLYDERGRIPGLVKGLRYFFEVLGSVGRIELGDGTNLAAVKGILGGGAACGRTIMGCPLYEGPPAGVQSQGQPADGGAGGTAAAPGAGGSSTDPVIAGLPVPVSGSAGVTSLVEGLLGR
jgi:phospholipid/cholesterol/gamma-HCH transport system substrate-binding protein